MKALQFLVLFIILTGAISCQSSYYSLRKGLIPGYYYVPAGSVMLQDQLFRSKALMVKSTEVTNQEYHRYLNDLLQSGDTAAYTKAYPDTIVLKEGLWIQNHLDYFNHIMFKEYPVVGISRSQAEGYASWLTKKVAAEKGSIGPVFRLPSKYEWQYAALGGRDIVNNYGWGGKSERNSKGCYLMHYFNTDMRAAIYGYKLAEHEVLDTGIEHTQYELEWDRMKESSKDLTLNKGLRKGLPYIGLPVPAYTYFPNDYGLYNMHGNVAEYVDDTDNPIMGGSYRTSALYCGIQPETAFPFYSEAFPDVGFRLVADYMSTNQ